MSAAYHQFCQGLPPPWGKLGLKMPQEPLPASKEGRRPHVSYTRGRQELPTNDKCSTGSTFNRYPFKQLTGLGRAGAYVFIYVPREHPSLEV